MEGIPLSLPEIEVGIGREGEPEQVNTAHTYPLRSHLAANPII